MAIKLAKVALWIETVEPGKPLSFLDAHLRCGDSLLGVYDLKALEIGIPDDAYKPLTGDDKKAASAWKARNKSERDARKQGELSFFEPPKSLLESARALEALAEDDLKSVEAKAEAYQKLSEGDDRHRMEAACNLYVAAFLMPKSEPPVRTVGGAGAFIPTSRDVWDKLAGSRPLSLLEKNAIAVAKAARTFHWPLEFPQVFFPTAARKTGFDLAIGNPPWEVSQLSELEYFASKAPEIANLPGKLRKNAIAKLSADNSPLWTSYQLDKRISEANNIFYRGCGRYALTAIGKVNTYSLFAELFSAVGRRAGFIAPTGLAMDATTAPFFSHLVQTRRIASFIDFENRERLFPEVYFRVRFCLVTLADRVSQTRFSCFLTRPGQMADHNRKFALSPEEINAINPNSGTAPAFRSEADAKLTKQMYARLPVIFDERKNSPGNPWGIEFRQGLFNMTSESEFFRTALELEAKQYKRTLRGWSKGDDRYVPLYEAKMIHHYNHRFADFANAQEKDDTDIRELPQADAILLSDPRYEPEPRYWVPNREVTSRLAAKGWQRKWLMTWRDITNVTNERTVIACAIPRSGIGHNSPIFFLSVETKLWAAFLAIISSLSFDYVARQKVGGTHLTYSYLNQLPCPAPKMLSAPDLSFIVPRVLELTYTSYSMKPFAEDLGYGGEPLEWNLDRRALLRAELDAKIANLYGLTRDQLRYVLDPADVYGADYPSETFRVLKNNDIAKYGEYRTAKLVLQAYDQITAGALATEVVRLDADKIEVRTPAPTSIPLAVNTWARSRIDARGEAGAMVAALLKTIDGPTPIRQLRLAAVLALEPRLLTQQLDVKLSGEWQRLIGDDARPLPKGTVQFVPPADETWGAAVRGLRARGNLVEDLRAGTWAPGTGLDKIETEGWPEGRAGFVLEFLRSQGNQPVFDALPEEARRWLDAEAA